MGQVIDRIIEICAKNKLTVFIITGFAVIGGIIAVQNIPLDAIPDLSDTQVIVFSTWDRPPQVIEDQVTYPIVAALLGAPKVKDIRGFSDYGFSYVYIIFEDGTDIYWARSRVLEYLSKVIPALPEGVKTELGPDATGVGWVFEYALVDESGKHSLEELTTFQNWHLKYALQSVRGVSEVASIGGFVKQYQVIVNPDALLQHNIPITDVVLALKRSNQETGARLIEFSGKEYMVTIRGYITSLDDIKKIVLKVDANGIPVTIKDVATVQFGPDIRRGVADLNGEGEVVGGIVVMRYRENALKVIDAVKKKLRDIKLPEGVKLVVTYDRSDLILRSIDTLRHKLFEEMIVVSAVIVIFLGHVTSALIPIITLPIAVIISFIPMYFMGLTSNIMSLGGIAIAIGAMVDAAIVVVENAHRRLSHWGEQGKKGDYREVIIPAIKEVGRPSFFSLLVIAISFLPIFTLTGVEGRLFKPLAFTKTFAMFFAAFLAITLVPALMLLFMRGTGYRSEEKHPISRALFRWYEPVVRYALKRPYVIVISAVMVFVVTVPLFFKLGKEFMPPLNEGSILYMPTTPPGISVTEATRLLKVQDRILKTFPEVLTVFGKAGRGMTSTDPAPYSMMETVVVLKPANEWRRGLSWEGLINEMDEKLRLPGQVNSWTMPIKARIDMLTTGVRTAVGIKIYGDDLKKIEAIGGDIEQRLRPLKGTRSVYAERTAGGYFVNFILKKDEIARYGLTVQDVQMALMATVGGENVTQTVEGRERFPVNIRYPRELRDDIEKLKNIYIPTPAGAAIPVAELAVVELATGPSMIRDENGALAGYVYVDVEGRDVGGYVAEAKEALRKDYALPQGYSIVFSGQYEFMERVKDRMKIVLPLTLFIIFFLIRGNTGSYAKTFIVLLAVPFSLVGVVWALYLFNYNLSIGVWAGIIALLGVDAETGIFMLLFLDLAYEDMKKRGEMKTADNLREAILSGAVKRVRPKMMTACVLFIGLLPIMWAPVYETGADVMKRIAAPMVGGILASFIMELILYPAVYFLWKKKGIDK
ncbi:MAG: CusA/CzcA family heavy metal efflux RND transporter [Candidatus Omnitrophica bacterium]|nr:CusA/CzcA family heavy metal efflux RND transporter [Candidatus Omnitrophota bacterium]